MFDKQLYTYTKIVSEIQISVQQKYVINTFTEKMSKLVKILKNILKVFLLEINFDGKTEYKQLTY